MKLFTTSSNTSHLALLVALALSLFALAGCNTIDGAGKDIERAGEEIQNATD
ncbi:MAG: entericidin A/B family lipoprotein [Porticoccaceae bacterium]|nr:entericidin A/B family lipoprotein [Porticoccaceae bacterium]